MSEAMRRGTEAALTFVDRAQLVDLLGSEFVPLPTDDEGVAVWVSARWGNVVEAAVEAGGRLASPGRIVAGEDARLWLADHLQRRRDLDDVVTALSAFGGGPPLVLDAGGRSRRYLLPNRPWIVEVRGRRTVDRVRVLPEDDVYRALDTALRMTNDRSAVESRFGATRPLADVGLVILEDSAIAFRLDAGGGYRLALGAVANTALVELVAGMSCVEAVDDLLFGAFERVDRRETVGPAGRPRVAWRLPALAGEVRWPPQGG